MKAKKLGYIGFDQYGHHYIIDRSPRKELLKKLGRSHASKMYTDTANGESKHVGYIIAGLWITIYAICEWKEATK